MKTTTQTLRRLKGVRPIVAVTAYDTPTARLADAAGVDLILVGDSVGNVMLGFDSTVPVNLDMMVHHTSAVARANTRAMVAADVPFAEAHFDFERVLASCQRLIQVGGAAAVKVEATSAQAPMIARLVEAGIPVWGHVGLKPQQLHTLGKYRKFGRTADEAESVLADALALEAAGCFALLLELTDAAVAARITARVAVPTVGIGAGPDVDGQILVCADLLGLNTGYVPGFARAFAEVGDVMARGFAAYTEAVRQRTFPGSPPAAPPAEPTS
ncbi:MAG TPA: 3-methyl-2-oxobutanoate hydroxymethyltransferase [Opitutaceae bacterium]|nr:3-methyl-2-oxobutanoate hydroxymethyltransferase [Opitutaceae bacterium]HRE08397.1 3-methyl-2-oxobutanoate hydroxymethyltransferase [Opitutaceae bacterium]